MATASAAAPTYEKEIMYVADMDNDVNLSFLLANGSQRTLTVPGRISGKNGTNYAKITLDATIDELTISDPKTGKSDTLKARGKIINKNETLNGDTVYVIRRNTINPTRDFRLLDRNDIENLKNLGKVSTAIGDFLSATGEVAQDALRNAAAIKILRK